MEIVAAEFVGAPTSTTHPSENSNRALITSPTPTRRSGDARIWLRDYLAGGHQESGAVIAAGEAAGFHASTIKRARESHRSRRLAEAVSAVPRCGRLPSAHPVRPTPKCELDWRRRPNGGGKRGKTTIPTRASAPSAHSARTGSDDELTGQAAVEVEALIAQIDQARNGGACRISTTTRGLGSARPSRTILVQATVECPTAILASTSAEVE